MPGGFGKQLLIEGEIPYESLPEEAMPIRDTKMMRIMDPELAMLREIAYRSKMESLESPPAKKPQQPPLPAQEPPPIPRTMQPVHGAAADEPSKISANQIALRPSVNMFGAGQNGQANSPPGPSPIAGTKQPPRITGMQSTPGFTPARSHLPVHGSAAAGPSKVDQMSCSFPTSVDMFGTVQNGQASIPLPANSNFIANGSGNCSYVKSAVNQGPSPIAGTKQPARITGIQSNPGFLPARSHLPVLGSAAAGPSTVDPNRISSSFSNSSVGMFRTGQNGQGSTLPPTNSNFITNGTGNCSYVRSAVNQVPPMNKIISAARSRQSHREYFRQVQGPQLFCKQCQVSCLSPKELKAHYRGKKHKSRVQILRGNIGPKAVICDICMVASSDENSFQLHLAGKHHAARLEAINTQTNLR